VSLWNPRFFRCVDHRHRKAQTTHDVLCQKGIIYLAREHREQNQRPSIYPNDFVLRRSVIIGPDVIFKFRVPLVFPLFDPF
jgi:hypothetical protein